jgi:hypothetical protein
VKYFATVDFIKNLVVLMRVFSFRCLGGGRRNPAEVRGEALNSHNAAAQQSTKTGVSRLF